VPELTSELQQLADDAARHARPSAAADIFAAGDARRRRSRTRQALGGLSAAGVAGAGVALGLALASSAPGHATGTIQTAAFTLVSHADGTATLTIDNNVLFDPATLQRDLARDGIAAKVTTGSFCSSDPAPAGVAQVISAPKIQPGQAPTVVINPAAMAAGTELSVGNFQLADSGRTYLTLIDTGSYTCASTAPTAASRNVAVFGLNRSPSH
jgi:hypothetical protein